MRSVSSEFLATIERRRNFNYNITCTFTDGTEKVITNNDILSSGSSISEGAGTSSFSIGNAIAKTLTLALENGDDRFDTYDFFGATFNVSISLMLDSGTEEFVPIGKFTVLTPETYGSTITVTAIDDMYKSDVVYVPTVTFPCTVWDIFQDACNCAGLARQTDRFINSDYQVTSLAENYTCRQIIGWCAMFSGGNARVSATNLVEILTYNLSSLYSDDGGTFKFDGKTEWGAQETTASGGNFEDYTSGDTLDGGLFTDSQDLHTFSNAINLTIPTDNVIITGVQTTGEVVVEGTEQTETKTFIAGTDDYVLNVENGLFSDYQSAVDLIYAELQNVVFRPFELNAISDPTVEVGDVCYVVDRKSNYYPSFVTDVVFNIGGGITVKCSADSPLRNRSKFNSESSNVLIKTRELINTEKTDREKSLENLNTLMANSLGFFTTDEIQEGGGVIRYNHNKPKLEDSNIIWKVTELGFQVSTDGGTTWKAGFDANGNAVVNVLSAVGLNADWITAGTITGRTISGGKLISEDGEQKTTIEGGTLTTNNAVITGGSINIKTNSTTTDSISLQYNSFEIQLFANAIMVKDTSKDHYAVIQPNYISVTNEYGSSILGDSDGISENGTFLKGKYAAKSTETTASNAQSTANSAYSLASSAYSLAGSASSDASSAQSSADSAYIQANTAAQAASSALIAAGNKADKSSISGTYTIKADNSKQTTLATITISNGVITSITTNG